MEFKVFTLNCWGIPVISKDKNPRFKAIAEYLALNTYDVVCLQEVWTDTDFNLIKEMTIDILPHSHYFYSGVVGSGVCILSKYPFQDVFFHQWPVNGYIHKLQHGDWFGGKGVGLCRLLVNDYTIDVYSAHLHAEYNRSCDEYKAHRVLQAYDTAQFIQLTSAKADLIVLAGDLNTEPLDLAYQLLLSVTGLSDSYLKADEDAQKEFATNEGLKNSYTPSSLIKKACPGKRIDYILYEGGPKVKVDVRNYSMPLPERVPDCSYSYSDHEGVTATLILNPNDLIVKNKDNTILETVLNEAMLICDDALKKCVNQKRLYWFLSAILFILLIVTIATDAPFNLKVLYHVLRVILTAFLIFTILMGTLWNKIERNGILAGRLAMGISLRKQDVLSHGTPASCKKNYNTFLN